MAIIFVSLLVLVLVYLSLPMGLYAAPVFTGFYAALWLFLNASQFELTSQMAIAFGFVAALVVALLVFLITRGVTALADKVGDNALAFLIFKPLEVVVSSLGPFLLGYTILRIGTEIENTLQPHMVLVLAVSGGVLLGAVNYYAYRRGVNPV